MIVPSAATMIEVALVVVEEVEGAKTVLEVHQDATVSIHFIDPITSIPMACAQLFPEC